MRTRCALCIRNSTFMAAIGNIIHSCNVMPIFIRDFLPEIPNFRPRDCCVLRPCAKCSPSLWVGACEACQCQ